MMDQWISTTEYDALYECLFDARPDGASEAGDVASSGSREDNQPNG